MEKIYTLWKIERRTNSLNQESKIFLLDNDSIETFYLETSIPSYFFTKTIMTTNCFWEMLNQKKAISLF